MDFIFGELNLKFFDFRARPDSFSLTIPQASKNTCMWFDVNCFSFCSFYKMEGINPENPETDTIVSYSIGDSSQFTNIYFQLFEINASYLLAALADIKKAVNLVEIKLCKQDFPFFNVQMRIQSAADSEKSVDGSHQVPVIIIPRLRWSDYEILYSAIPFEAQVKCPRFFIMKKFIDTFKYASNIRFVLRNDDSMTLEASCGGTSRHFTIFNKVKVYTYPKFDTKYKGPSVSAIIDYKKLSTFIHSLNFQAEIRLCCMVKSREYVKLFFRLRDDILAHYIIPAEFEEFAEPESPGEVEVVRMS